MSAAPLERITIEPTLPATACVIWLHGLGDSGAGFSPIVPELGLPKNHPVRFVFPHAPEQPVTINQGYVMRSWYDIKSMDLHNRADMQGVLESEVKVRALISEQISAGIPASNIVLAGFSQGGVVVCLQVYVTLKSLLALWRCHVTYLMLTPCLSNLVKLTVKLIFYNCMVKMMM